jgi:hypothetical protein
MLLAVPRTVRAALALAAFGALLAAGCGDDADDDGEGAATTTTEEPATTAAPAPPTTDDEAAPTDPTGATTNTAGAGPAACPDGDPLAGAADVGRTVGDVDVDGDGTADAVRAGRVDGGWILAAELSTGGVASGPVPATGGPVGVRPLGGAPVDDEPGDEVVVQAGAGAAAVLVGLHRLDGCELAALRLGPDPARFPVGATVTRTDGVSCPDGGGLVHRSGESLDGVTYEVVARTYAVDGDELVVSDTEVSSVGPDDPGFAALARLDCGTARLG